MKALLQYFPDLTPLQLSQFSALPAFYEDWNSRVNLISRKDIHNIFEHHILHSLAIAKYTRIPEGSRVLDLGTGGGFPGIPLAIFFPDSEFVLVDSIHKKIKVVENAVEVLQLRNVRPLWSRAEVLPGKYDIIVSRAVAPLHDMIRWSAPLVRTSKRASRSGQLIYLKGGDVSKELASISNPTSVHKLSTWFEQDYFQEKVLIHIHF